MSPCAMSHPNHSCFFVPKSNNVALLLARTEHHRDYREKIYGGAVSDGAA